uniref:Kazal-like domain-containing protein n=1 Tax=Clastoptera arizonana TaxID=38151 RepID=A0A1B6D2D3_9HEMI
MIKFCFVFLALAVVSTVAFNTRFILDETQDKLSGNQDQFDDNITVEDESSHIQDIFLTLGNQFLNHLKNIQTLPNPSEIIKRLNETVMEINKTAQVIRLTAEYINISANYILSTINNKGYSDLNKTKESIDAISKILINTLVNHINSTINDIQNKSKLKLITGEGMLFSISYHLVNAFQEMTNMTLNIAGMKNDSQTVEAQFETTEKDMLTNTDNKFADTLDTAEVFSPVEFKSDKNLPIDTIEVFSPVVEIKPENTKNIPFYYLTSWTECNSLIRPVCAVDLKIKKYIIFLNDCRRIAHNQMHGTNYTVYSMDVCTVLFLKKPGFNAQVASMNGI